jgi:tRNA-Thr(GGU) m(6)t(6)A37 methyltransferase TsaA
MSDSHSTGFSLQVIGRVHGPFQEKFGIPRQPGLADVPAVIEMLAPYDVPEMFEGLEEFSHLWLSFVFHACLEQGWRKKVRPPRLGGNVHKGVFATRSPFRPNHLGLSVVKLDRLETVNGRVKLHVRGGDLLDRTPIVDIKPYISYTDSIAQASSGFAAEAPAARLQVVFSPEADRALSALPDAKLMTSQLATIISLDPRPAYQRNSRPERIWGMRFAGLDVRWQVRGDQALVIAASTGSEQQGNQ